MPIDAQAMAQLGHQLRGRRIAVLAGAGCSTASGIPDYRGPSTRRRARQPMQYRRFVQDPEARRRYWARSMLGWPRFLAAMPNSAHLALARLEHEQRICGIITQNVDRLHHAAGSRNVLELHGALHEVVCLSCGKLHCRNVLQRALQDANPRMSDVTLELRPDGDAEIDEQLIRQFRYFDCRDCDGILKPRVVFFGESVPKPVVEASYALLEQAEVLLVVGSSLTVFSGYRFVRRAAATGKPVIIVNHGPTRGDPQADLRIDADVCEVLPRLASDAELGRAPEHPGPSRTPAR